MKDNTDNKPIEIVLGNKNVAEAGSTQVNITQNNITAEAISQISGLLNNGFGTSDNPQPTDTPSKPKQTKKPPRDVQEVFRYKWMDRHDARQRLICLYKVLTHKNYGWIDGNVTPDEWCALFMGTPQRFKIKWKKSQAFLKHMFDLMIERGYIEVSGSAGKWEILGSHFLSSSGRPFPTAWNKVAKPTRGADVIEKAVEVLNISKTFDDVNIEELDYEKPRFENSFDEESCIIPKAHNFKRNEDY